MSQLYIIKPLEWTKNNFGDFVSKTPFGVFVLSQEEERWEWYFRFGEPSQDSGWHLAQEGALEDINWYWTQMLESCLIKR